MRIDLRGVSLTALELVVVLTGLQLLVLPEIAYAVLPPDLVVSVGSQIAGFFSLLVAVLVSVFASIGVLYIGWYERFKKYSVYIAFGLLSVVLLLSNGLYLWHINQMPVQEIPRYPALPVATTTDDCISCAFYSESITLYVPDSANPLVAELDLNRRQEPDGQFTHYYFLNGVVDETTIDEYTQFSTHWYTLQSNSYLTNIKRTEAIDASVRDIYSGSIELPTGALVTFITEAVQGDFITRNKPEYTQFQSVVKAEVNLNGVAKTAYALVENLQSNNYRKRVFFTGMDSLQALTHQFVLWDEAGNFYMIDDSVVFSDTPAYPTHSWLLYKSATDNTTKKGFSTTITSESSGQWTALVPDFANGVIEVHATQEYKKDRDGRSRYVVFGTITDDTGTRSISGLLRLVR
jgi:hypothetical protein